MNEEAEKAILLEVARSKGVEVSPLEVEMNTADGLKELIVHRICEQHKNEGSP